MSEQQHKHLDTKTDEELSLMLNHEMVMGFIRGELSKQIMEEKARRYALQRTSTQPE